MQNGMKAGLAITLAVFLTGIVGFLTAVVPIEEDRTYYTQVSDLTPIIDATAIDSYTEYNPITNVSGWSDAPGTTIEFLTHGVSAYPYRHYIQSEQYLNYSTDVYSSGILTMNWSSMESAFWYPLSNVKYVDDVNTNVSYHGITMQRPTASHITVQSDYMSASTSSYSVYIAHYDENNNLVHGFTYTYKEVLSIETAAYNYKEDHITTLSALDNATSQIFTMHPLDDPASTGISGYLDVDVSLPTGHYLYGAFITYETLTNSGIANNWVFLGNGNITERGQYDSASSYVKYNGGINWLSRSDNFNQNYVGITLDLKLNGSTVDTSKDGYITMPLSQYLTNNTVNDNTTMFLDNRFAFYHGSSSWTSDLGDNINQTTGTYHADLTSFGGYITYVVNDGKWYPSVLSDNGLYYVPDISQAGYPTSEIYIVAKGFHSYINAWATYPVYEYKYVDGNKFVTIDSGYTGSWKNYMDSTVGGQTITSNYQNGKVVLLTEPGTTITSNKVVWKDLDGNKVNGTMTVTIPASIPYSMTLVTLDFQSGEYYAQGVVWGAIDAADRTTNNWTLRPYQYTMSPSFIKAGTPTSDSPSYTEGLQFSKSGGTRVFIVSTDVMTDPLGRLWGDPNVYVAYYFPDYFNYDNGNTGTPTTAIRVLFNGFVSYGNSLTINGQYMPIEDGNITFTYYTQETILDDTVTPPIETTVTVTNTGTFPIKGMAVDWEDGHVYLVFTEKGTTRYDLGEYDETSKNVVIDGVDTGKDTVATDIIKGTGVWYWQSNLYTISHGTETTLHLDLSQGLNGWGMSIQVSMLLFAGMLILGTGLVHYFYRDSDEPMSLLEWVIIGAAILLSIGVAMT